MSLWNRFETEKKNLNIYEHPAFEAESGITDVHEIRENILKMSDELKNEPRTLVKAKIFAYILENAAIEVYPKDWFGINLAGWISGTPCEPRCSVGVVIDKWIRETPKTPEFEAAAKNVTETGAGIFWPDYDHSVPDWDSVTALGFPGLLKRAEQYKNKCEHDGQMTAEKRDYYDAIEIVYTAILAFMDRLLAVARKHEADDEIMPHMIRCLEQLQKGAPETLYEMMMLTYLYHMFQQHVEQVQVRTIGNIDVDYYPFYKHDLENGSLTPEHAKELFKYFLSTFQQQGHLHAQPLYLGGFDENGASLVNELSYMILEAHAECHLINPKIHIKVMPNTPDAFLKKALDNIRNGCNCIVFVNEQLGIELSKKLGRSDEECRRLVATGCNNFASRGHESTPEHMYVNLAKAIELALNDGFDPTTGLFVGERTGDCAAFKSYEDFYEAVKKQAKGLIEKAFVISDYFDAHLLDYNPTPMYSATMTDSLACGRDAYFNGMKYNNTVIFLSCHATVADSLMMVKKYVYEQGRVSLGELRDILKNNWVGHEDLWQAVHNDEEKFGNDSERPDAIAVDFTNYVTGIVTARKTVKGGKYVVNGESIWFAEKFGALCGATPDGRHKGDVLSKNMGESMGMAKKGITALIKSVTKIDATNYAYGAPFDYILHPTATSGDDGLTAMLGLLRTFMARGGYGMQGNVLDSKTLRDAQKHPENYENLQVRICGWNWYFNKMEKLYQDEFIKRTESIE